MRKKIMNRMREHREMREFDRMLATATPAVQQELLAIVGRQNFVH